MPKSQKKQLSVDDQLTEHLKEAEHHLIEAVTLFAEKKQLSRRTGYLTRLVHAQETITGLHREELIRVRGPRRPKSHHR